MLKCCFRPALLLPLAAMLGCGDPTPVKSKPVEPAAPPVVVTAQPPPAPPPRLPDAPALPSNPISKPGDLPPAPPISKELAKPAGTPGGKRTLDEFDPDVVGGRPIGQWMEMLNSEKKDDIIEAAEALKMVPPKAKKALPRLEELTKNSDKEIADEAKEAIKTINGK